MCWQQISYLANTLALHGVSLHLGEVVIVGHYIGDDGFLIRVLNVHIWKVWTTMWWRISQQIISCLHLISKTKQNEPFFFLTKTLQLFLCAVFDKFIKSCSSDLCHASCWCCVQREPTFSFQKGSESQLVFGHWEGVLQVLNGAGLVQFVILDQVRSETATRPH